jgi:DNA-binding transcriptional MocR family regulator
MLELAQYQIRGSTARGIAHSTEAAIRDGALAGGNLLPTVRALAAALGTSPATVSSAYRLLRERGLVVAEGRRGTRVAPRPATRAPEPGRRAVQPAPPGTGLRDLAGGLPDPALLPALEPAMARVDIERKLRISGLGSGDQELLEVAAEAFARDAIPARALAVVSGAFDALERALQAHLRPGDRVIIEDPAYTSTRDLLLALGLRAVPVPVDEYGLRPEAFASALARGAQAVIVVPRAQNPFGAAMDDDRVSALRRSLGDHPELLVVEDDHASTVAGVPCSTLVGAERTRWVVIRSVSKILHPDLRLALMAGDEVSIGRIEGRQALGPRWVSHLLQAVVAELLRDPEFDAISAQASEVYTARRQALLDALAAHGLSGHGRSGLNVWVPVHEEAPVLSALHDAGWSVLAGERFRLETPPGIRVTVATLGEHEAQEVARVIAEAQAGGRPRRQY